MTGNGVHARVAAFAAEAERLVASARDGRTPSAGPGGVHLRPARRDRATFGLARQTDEDFPRLRDALADRLHDDDLDTRLEAVHGLATRGDERVMQPLLDLLESPPEPSDPGLVSEALCALATTTVDPRLRSHLLAERDRFREDPIDDWPDDLRAVG